MKVGVLGGGQLARMLAFAGMPLGLEFCYFERAQTGSVNHLGPLTVGRFADVTALNEFAKQADVITFESENIPQATLEFLLETHNVRPGLTSLITSQNRFNEKTLFHKLDVPTVAFARVATRDQLVAAADKLGLPLIVKTISGGYDGKGQYRIHTMADIDKVVFDEQTVYLAEEWLDFDFEVSCVAVRNQQNEMRHYDLCLNKHDNGILVETTPIDHPDLERNAVDYTQRIMQALEHIGVLTVEFFVKDGALLANEIAPRVHNTGHWTIDAAVCSQFENHLRAVCDLPLGDTKRMGSYKMYNIIGQWPPNRCELLKTPGLHLHDYRKAARLGRKLGHITIVDP